MNPLYLGAIVIVFSGPLPAKEMERAARIDKLIEQLDSDHFLMREKATEELIKIGKPAIEALKAIQLKSGSAEVVKRAERILESSNRVSTIHDIYDQWRALPLEKRSQFLRDYVEKNESDCLRTIELVYPDRRAAIVDSLNSNSTQHRTIIISYLLKREFERLERASKGNDIAPHEADRIIQRSP